MRLVFVSSTFKDMQFERDALKVRVAPRIDGFLAKYGENVHFGDLRWGVNTSELESEESSKKVLKVCLDEIDDCRPYMIVFIGERYGWIPSSSLLEETMAMKGITDVPSDISVTNLEIEYGALINPDYEGRILFYFRNPIDTSEMSEEEKKIYEAESPLHKEKLDNLKRLIEEKYPNYIRHYDAKYDKATKSLVGLEPLMDQISDDLKRIFDLDLSKLNSLPPQERAVQNAHAFMERYYKNAYMRNDATLHEWDLDYEDEIEADERNLPLVEMITGEEGSGRKTLLALKYKLSLEEEKELNIPFVFNLDEFSDTIDKFFATLIYKIEEFAHKKISNSSSIEYLANLLSEIEQDKPFITNVFVANADENIITALKLLEAYQPTWYIINFYLENDDFDDNSRDLPQFKYNFFTEVEPLEDDEKIEIIRAIAKSRHKEISNQVIQKIIEKEASDNPLYLSLIVERLLMLDHEDFQNIRRLGDGMEAINKYMSSIVDNAGINLKGIAKDLLKEIIERTNPEMALKLVAINTLKNHLNKNALEQLFKYYDWPFNDLDYSLFKRLIPSLFAISSNDSDSIWFKNDDIREAAKELIKDYKENNHLDDIIAWIENVEVDDVVTERFIHRCKACFYKEKGDVNKFVDNFLSLIDEEKGDSFATFSDEYIKRLSKYSKYYIDALTKSYRDNEEFFELVDDEIVDRVAHYQIKNHVVLMNIYHAYYSDERHSPRELLNLVQHHFALTYKFLEKYRDDNSNAALKDITNFYAFLSSGMDYEYLLTAGDEEALDVLRFYREEKVVQYVQQMKNEGKLKVKLMISSIFDSYKNAYKLAMQYNDASMKRQFLMAIDAYEQQLAANQQYGSLFKAIFNGEYVSLKNQDKAFFGTFPQMMLYAAMLALEFDERKANSYYQKACSALLVFLRNLNLEDAKDERAASGLTEAIKTLMEYNKETKSEIDDDLAKEITLKIKLFHAFHPGDLHMTILGVRFGVEGKVDENSFDTFRYFFPEAYRGLLDLPKIKYDDLLAVIIALMSFKDEYLYSDITDDFARNLIVDAYDKDTTEEGLEMVFDMIYYYADDLEKDKLKDKFLLSVIDEMAGLFEDVEGAKDTLMEAAKEYINNL